MYLFEQAPRRMQRVISVFKITAPQWHKRLYDMHGISSDSWTFRLGKGTRRFGDSRNSESFAGAQLGSQRQQRAFGALS